MVGPFSCMPAFLRPTSPPSRAREVLPQSVCTYKGDPLVDVDIHGANELSGEQFGVPSLQQIARDQGPCENGGEERRGKSEERRAKREERR
jgi:hypothetical protein